MKIEQQIDLHASVDRVWAFFDDVPRVASCMPGATLSEIVDTKTFEGNVALKVGPIGVNYQGRLVIEERDDSSRTIRLKADGRDRKGGGNANAHVVATLTETELGCTRLTVVSDVQLSGRMATLGRGVQDVAGKIFAQFGSRISEEIALDTAEVAQPAGSGATSEGAVASDATSRPTTAQGGEPIKVGPLLWSILRDKLANLIRRLVGHGQR